MDDDPARLGDRDRLPTSIRPIGTRVWYATLYLLPVVVAAGFLAWVFEDLQFRGGLQRVGSFTLDEAVSAGFVADPGAEELLAEAGRFRARLTPLYERLREFRDTAAIERYLSLPDATAELSNLLGALLFEMESNFNYMSVRWEPSRYVEQTGELRLSPALRGAVEDAIRQIDEAEGDERYMPDPVRLSTLVLQEIEGSNRAPLLSVRTYPRFDRIGSTAALFLVLFFGAAALRREARPEPEVVELTAPAAQRGEGAPVVDAEAELVATVDNARLRSRQLYQRSLHVLLGGVAMAFVGIAVYIYSAPAPIASRGELEQPASPSIVDFAVEPLFVLVFVQGVAWFLLRQYRALIEDYKTVFRMYLSRSNRLVAYRMLQTPSRSKVVNAYIGVLMSEDFGQRLGSGETTEALAAMQATDQNPVLEMFRTILGLGSRTSKE